jgi:hypothetical protein
MNESIGRIAMEPIEYMRVVALSQQQARSQVEKTTTPQRASSVDNTSQDWER